MSGIKRRRDYGAERREAARWADKMMDHVSVTDERWTQTWEYLYHAYLAGLRRKAYVRAGK